MRKLKLQMQISLDGFPQYGENNEQHWEVAMIMLKAIGVDPVPDYTKDVQ